MKLNIHLNGFAMRKDLFNRKDKVSILILPNILVKNGAISKITP